MKAIKLLSWILGIVALVVGPARPANAAPTIEGALKYQPHELVKLKAVGADPKAAILWRVSPSRGFQRADTARELLQGAAIPGVYEVDLLVISQGADGLRVDEARATVEVASCHPPTPPTPPAPRGKADAAIGRLAFAGAGCTATPIEPRRADGRYDLLTAAHCVPGVGSRGTWTCQDGRTLAVVVVANDKGADICWLRTVETPAAPLPTAVLATDLPSRGTKVWQAGYGVQVPRNREEGQYIQGENTEGQLEFYISVSSGDSGGPIVNASTDEVLAPVCCTQRKGEKASVWGGSCRRAWTMRRALADGASVPDWVPVPIPEIPSPYVPPMEMPIVGAGVAMLCGRRRAGAELPELADTDLEPVASGKGAIGFGLRNGDLFIDFFGKLEERRRNGTL